jgi:hypothetical protein
VDQSTHIRHVFNSSAGYVCHAFINNLVRSAAAKFEIQSRLAVAPHSITIAFPFPLRASPPPCTIHFPPLLHNLRIHKTIVRHKPTSDPHILLPTASPPAYIPHTTSNPPTQPVSTSTRLIPSLQSPSYPPCYNARYTPTHGALRASLWKMR